MPILAFVLLFLSPLSLHQVFTRSVVCQACVRSGRETTASTPPIVLVMSVKSLLMPSICFAVPAIPFSHGQLWSLPCQAQESSTGVPARSVHYHAVPRLYWLMFFLMTRVQATCMPSCYWISHLYALFPYATVSESMLHILPRVRKFKRCGIEFSWQSSILLVCVFVFAPNVGYCSTCSRRQECIPCQAGDGLVRIDEDSAHVLDRFAWHDSTDTLPD